MEYRTTGRECTQNEEKHTHRMYSDGDLERAMAALPQLCTDQLNALL